MSNLKKTISSYEERQREIQKSQDDLKGILASHKINMWQFVLGYCMSAYAIGYLVGITLVAFAWQRFNIIVMESFAIVDGPIEIDGMEFILWLAGIAFSVLILPDIIVLGMLKFRKRELKLASQEMLLT